MTDLDDRLAKLEAAHLDLLASHAELAASHRALAEAHRVLRQSHAADRLEVPAAAETSAGGSAAASAASLAEADGGASAQAVGRAGTSRRMLIGGGLAGVAGLATGALFGAEPAAATSGAMQFGANNNAGTSGTNLTSSAVDKTLFLENTGSGEGLRVTSSGPGGVVTAAGIGLTVTSTGTIGIDVNGKTTALNAETTTGVALRATSDSGTAGIFDGNQGAGIRSIADGAQLTLSPNSVGRTAPTGDLVVHFAGELIRDAAGDLWQCVSQGTPGSWRKVGGPATAGALHVLASPVRVYDSRPGTLPNIGSKTKFTAGELRTLDCDVNSSKVPSDATAVMVTCLIVNADAGNGNFTVWKGGAAKPSANTMVWGGSTGRASTLALSALGPGAQINVSPSLATDLVVDVVAFYR